MDHGQFVEGFAGNIVQCSGSSYTHRIHLPIGRNNISSVCYMVGLRLL